MNNSSEQWIRPSEQEPHKENIELTRSIINPQYQVSKRTTHENHTIPLHTFKKGSSPKY